jgi:hypothetical protein
MGEQQIDRSIEAASLRKRKGEYPRQEIHSAERLVCMNDGKQLQQ